MTSAAVLRMNGDNQPRMSNVTGSRKSILASITASSAQYGNQLDDQDSHAHPIPISSTDALLRARRTSDTSSMKPNGNRSRSASIASRQEGKVPGSPNASTRSPVKSKSYNLNADDTYLAPRSVSRSRSFAESLKVKKSNSDLSKDSENIDDSRSINSRRGSSGNSLVNLIRSRSRTSSQTNITTPDPATESGSRLRRFSSASRKMSLKIPGAGRRSSSASIRSANLYDEPEQLSSAPPVPAIPASYPNANGSGRKEVDGYKPVSPSVDSPLTSGRTRKFTKSSSQSEGLQDPFAKADETLARARSRSRSSMSQGRPRGSSTTQNQSDDTLEDQNAGDRSTDSRKSFLSSTTAKATGAVAGAAGAAGGVFGSLKRRKSQKSASEEPESASPNTNGAAVAANSDHEEDEESEDDQDDESADQDVAAEDNNEEDEDEESESEDEDDDQEGVMESSDEEDFFDAPLADIEEGEEDEEDQDSDDDDQHQHRVARAGGAAAAGAGAAAAAVGHRRKKSGLNGASKSPNGKSRAAAGKSYQPKGTAGASRRTGSANHAQVPGHVSTSNDAKMKSEVSQSVKDKAARVAKLSVNDVKISPSELHDDIEVARGALNLFLNSRMIEAEKIIEEHADRRLYYALGYALIATIKGFMTFEPADLAVAISLCKDSLTIASLLRKPTSAVSNFGRFVRGTGQSPSAMAQMDEVQRHAELVYAESLLLKAVLGIVYAGDFFAFVSEALNMRNAYGIYRSLSKYVEWTEEKGGSGAPIDEDFKSGVYLGNGLISMILGLLPGKVLKIMEVFGYTGDTEWALKTLSKAGQWSPSKSQQKPGMPIKQEGVRRQICDMALLMYHLVISTFIPVNGVDIDFADKVLHYNLRRYPEGVFFLYFSGRLYSTQALSEKAITSFETARDVQKEYVQLKHICIWDLALCNMSLNKWKGAHDQFQILAEENNWSKAVYNYGRAATLYESAFGEDSKAIQEAATIFQKVPSLTQKIAGKSIPMEKFVARKSKKFAKYNRLLLPGLEFSYVYHCLSNAPRYILCDEALMLVSDALAELHEVEDPSQYYSGEEYYDDLCLAHFLRGVCLKFIACPEPHSKVRPRESPIPEEEAAEQAEISFKTVLEHGHQLQLDHWLVYFAHYELGRLYAGRGRISEAKEQLNLVLSQKNLEDKGRKGKYSLQNMVHLRANGALNNLGGGK